MVYTRIDMDGIDIFNPVKPYKHSEYGFFTAGQTKIKPLEISSPILIITDPSKTEAGIAIGNEYGELLYIYTTSGVYPDGSRQQDTNYCADIKDFYLQLLGSCEIAEFAKEATILKEGTKFYRSMKVLEAISTTLQEVSNTLIGRDAFEINNWSWKNSVLPDDCRSQKEKGSLKWLSALSVFNKALGDNRTDAVCMYFHMIKNRKNNSIICNRNEQPSKEFSYALMPIEDINTEVAKPFIHNKKYSVFQNCAFYINRSSVPGYCQVDLNNLLKDEILDRCINLYPDSEVYLYVRKEEGAS